MGTGKDLRFQRSLVFHGRDVWYVSAVMDVSQREGKAERAGERRDHWMLRW